MENLNLPPFYVGQKVVYIGTKGTLPMKSIHTVVDIKRHPCGCWAVNVGRIADKRYGGINCTIHSSAINIKTNMLWWDSKVFAPIEERFISFAEVIAIESQVTGAN